MICPFCGKELVFEVPGDGTAQVCCDTCDFCFPNIVFSMEIDYDDDIRLALLAEYEKMCSRIAEIIEPVGCLFEDLQTRIDQIGENIEVMKNTNNNIWEQLSRDKSYRLFILKQLILIDACEHNPKVAGTEIAE